MIVARTTPSPLDDILQRAKTLTPVQAAIVNPYDDLALGGALAAAKEGLIAPVFVGHANTIRSVARTSQRFPAEMRIEDAYPGREAEAAAQLAARGAVQMLVKGSVHSDVLLRAVLAQPSLLSKSRLSHVVVTELRGRATPILLSDGAVSIAPSLDEKAQIVQNAVTLALRLGIESPRVALLAAVETVVSKMAATLDAAALTEMAKRGQISGGIVDGPLALDDAISIRAARAKELQSPVAGCADILISPDLEAGNILYKAFDVLLGARFGAVVTGALVPIVFTSRGDSIESRVLSTALARLLIEEASCPSSQKSNLTA